MYSTDNLVHTICVTHSVAATETNGNELDGSFYLTYHCESSVTSATVTVNQSNNLLLVLDTTGVVVAGDTLRVDIAGLTGLTTTSWRYFTISGVSSGTQVTVENAVDFADGVYPAEFGDFYSGPGMEYGVSTGCMQADPDTTNTPLAHDVSALDLQDALQGLAQVNSSSGCLQVIPFAAPEVCHRLAGVRPLGLNYSRVEKEGGVCVYLNK